MDLVLGWGHIQAFVVQNLNDRPNALLPKSRGWCSSKRAIPKKYCIVIAFCAVRK